MFKGFQKGQQFKGFPALNFQMNNEAYGFNGVSMWFNSNYGLNTKTNGANISQWVSRIGGLTLTQSTVASQPIYESADPSFNNIPSVNINGYGKRMLFNISPKITDTNPLIVCVYKNDSIGAGNAILSGSSSVGAIVSGGTSSNYDGFGFSGAGALNGNNEGLIAYVASISRTQCHINGVLQETGSASFNTSFIYLGGDLTTNGTITGRITDIIIYSNFDSSNIIQLHNNINNYYGNVIY